MEPFCPIEYQAALTGILAVVSFPILWTLVLGLISAITGWRRLATLYPAPPGDPEGTRWRFRTAGFRNASHYSGCLHFTATQGGLHMKLFLPFRPFHPPLLIPWDALRARIQHGWLRLGRQAELTFRPRPEDALLPRALTDPAAGREAGTDGLVVRITPDLARAVFSAAALLDPAEGARLLGELDREDLRP